MAIERAKLDSSLIIQTVSTGVQADAIRNLKFLIEIGLISDETLRKTLSQQLTTAPEDTAVLPAATAGDLFRSGIEEAKHGTLTDAIRLYQESLAQNPNNAETLKFLGFALYKQGRTDEAIAALEKAITLSPGATWARYNLSLPYLQGDLSDKAASEIQKLLQLDSRVRSRIRTDPQFRPYLEDNKWLTAIVGEN